MGYRLDIDMIGKSNPICCGKLFDYVDDNRKLLSCQWLISEGYIEEECAEWCFCYGFEGNFVLRGYKLKKFLELYIKDLDNDYGYDNTSLKQEINEYISKIEDYDKYVLMWG